METTHTVMDEQEIAIPRDPASDNDALASGDVQERRDSAPQGTVTGRTKRSRRTATPHDNDRPKPSPATARRRQLPVLDRRELGEAGSQTIQETQTNGIERAIERISEKIDTLLGILSLQAQGMTEHARAMMIQATMFRLRKKVLTFEEACTYLDVSESHLYKLTADGIVPHSKPNGKKLYFRRKELDVWLMSNPVRTQAEIESEAATYCLTHDRPRSRSRRAM